MPEMCRFIFLYKVVRTVLSSMIPFQQKPKGSQGIFFFFFWTLGKEFLAPETASAKTVGLEYSWRVQETSKKTMGLEKSQWERKKGRIWQQRVEARSDHAGSFNLMVIILAYTLSGMRSYLKTLSQGCIQCPNCQNNSFGHLMDYRL